MTTTQTVQTPVPLLTPDQVQDLLGVKRSWLYDQVQAGVLPHVRLGRLVRFEEQALLRWLDSCRVPGRIPD